MDIEYHKIFRKSKSQLLYKYVNDVCVFRFDRVIRRRRSLLFYISFLDLHVCPFKHIKYFRHWLISIYLNLVLLYSSMFSGFLMHSGGKYLYLSTFEVLYRGIFIV